MQQLKRIFLFGDLHCPYHNKEAFEIVLRAMRGFKPDIVISMGDFVDFFSVSNYSKDPGRALGLEEEIGQANVLLDRIDKIAPNAQRIFLGGNHCDRLQRYLQDKAPELFAFIDVPKLLHLDKRNWTYVPYKQSIQIGRAHFTHDVGSAGRYNVFRAIDTFQSPVVTGHTHRFAYIVEGDATGDVQFSGQFGWLGDVEQIDYMHRVKALRDWALGFGVGYLNPENDYVYLSPIPIVKGTAVVEGKLYTAERKRAA